MGSIRTALVVTIVCLTAAAPPAVADVRLAIRDGRISIVANDATVGQILSEWARIGQTTIVNAERIPRDPITIELTDVSEARALDVVLRSAGGYVAAPRQGADPGSSRFDRIIVMPPSALPLAPAGAAARAATGSTSPAYPASTYSQPEPGYRQPTPDEAPPAQPVSYVSSVQPETAPDTASDEPQVVSEAGAAPPPDVLVQATFKRRQALETVDPREFKMPAPPQGISVSPSSAPLPGRVGVVPGAIVQPASRPPR